MQKLTATLILALALAVAADYALAAKLYRWVDEEGRVHYSDKMPPEVVRREFSRLNERGIELERVDRAKTAEEIEQERQQALLRAEQQKLIEQQLAADRVLLRTFRSVDDIRMARDGQLHAVDLSVGVIETNIRQMKVSLSEMQRQAAGRELAGEAVAKNLQQEIEATRNALKEAYASIVERERDKNRIRDRFGDDIRRFSVLKKLALEQEDRKPANGEQGLGLPNVYECGTLDSCAAPWSRAEAFVREHATTRVQMLSEHIVMTAPPRADNDISLTLSLLPRKDRNGYLIFMDLQCVESAKGAEFCKDERVDAIRARFKPTLAGDALANR